MIIKNVKIINHNEIIENGFIEIENGKIVDYGTKTDKAGTDYKGKIVMPGFIDVHIHGTSGADVMDGTKEALDTMVTSIPKEGTTSFLATTLTMSEEKLVAVVKNIADYKHQNNGAKILGIHLEGPFINLKYKGAQNPEFVKEPSIKVLDNLLESANGLVKYITYAPEMASTEFTDYVVSKGIIASAGHSAATMSEMLTHADHGLTNITHFHNGQSGHHHRTPGIVSAGLYSDKLNTEIIVDGVHLHPDAVKLVHKVKTKDRVLLITDGMRAKFLENGYYDLGGLRCIKDDHAVRTEEGSLAGSILSMDKAVSNMINFTACDLTEIVAMTSYNQAKLLKQDHNLGKIAKGYCADLVILNENLEVQETIVDGKTVYKN